MSTFAEKILKLEFTNFLTQQLLIYLLHIVKISVSDQQSVDQIIQALKYKTEADSNIKNKLVVTKRGK